MHMANNEKIVRKFISYFQKNWPEDFEAAVAYLDADAYYQMATPTIPPVQGREAILKALQAMKSRVAEQEHEVINVAASDSVVFMERVDYSFRGGKWVSVPLVAVFELNAEGKITAWREYLDIYNNIKQHGVSFEEFEKTIGT